MLTYLPVRGCGMAGLKHQPWDGISENGVTSVNHKRFSLKISDLHAKTTRLSHAQCVASLS